MEANLRRKTQQNLMIRKCHVCGTVNEGTHEVSKCGGCHKSFLPLNYFSKVHDHTAEVDEALYASTDELVESDMIKGITVIW